jgi:hypothetical protein
MVEIDRASLSPSSRSVAPLFSPFREGDTLTIPVIGVCVGVFVLTARWASTRYFGLDPSFTDRSLSSSAVMLLSIALTAIVAALQPRREPMPWWGALTATLGPLAAIGVTLLTRGPTPERLAAGAIAATASVLASIGIAIRRR